MYNLIKKSKYTVIIVHINDITNIIKNQLPLLNDIEEIENIHILHYNIETYENINNTNIQQIKYWDTYKEYGYAAKYKLITELDIHTDAILFLDDFIHINKKLCKTLYSSWINEPSLLHGTNYLSLKYNTEINKYNISYSEEPHIILTNICMVSQSYIKEAFHFALTINDLMENIEPMYLAIDICLSIISACANKTKRRLHYYYENKNNIFKKTEYVLNNHINSDIITITIGKYFNKNKTLLLDTTTPYSDLLVIIPFFNFANFNKPYENISKTIDNLNKQNVNVVVMEAVVSGNISHLYTLPCNVITTKTDTIAFHKEGLFNKAFHTYKDYKDVFVLLDADIIFKDDLWPAYLLENMNSGVDVIQPYKQCHWTTKQGSIGSTALSYSYYRHLNYNPNIWKRHIVECFNNQINNYHCGFAWAFSKKFLLKTNGLFSKCFSGSGDIATLYLSEGFTLSENRWKYLQYLQPELNNFMKKGGGKHGNMEGEIYHLYHGDRKNRKYVERHTKIIENGISINSDLFDSELNDHLIKANNPIINKINLDYFKNRNEDD
jgi:hypothetical protein